MSYDQVLQGLQRMRELIQIQSIEVEFWKHLFDEVAF